MGFYSGFICDVCHSFGVHLYSLWLLVIHLGFISGFIYDGCHSFGVHLWYSYWGSSLGFTLVTCYSFGVHLWGLFVVTGWIVSCFVGVCSDNLFFGVRWLAFVIVRSRI